MSGKRIFMPCRKRANQSHLARQARIDQVHTQHRNNQQAYYFNGALNIAEELHMPFIPRQHAALTLDFESAIHLRVAFSGLVTRNG